MLTTLGIIIGIVSVTGMATVVNGIEKGFEQDMASLGTDVVYIEKWPWVNGPGFKWWDYINRPNITADLADAIVKRSRYVSAATAVVRTSQSVSRGNRSVSSASISGATSSYPRVHKVDIEDGYFFTDLDDLGARDVTVIGARIADELFPVEDPIGKAIRIGGNKFRVVGVLERKGQGADSPASDDLSLRIPFNSFKKHYGVRWRNVSVRARLSEGVTLDEARDELRGAVRTARKLDAKEADDFELNEQQTLREQIAPIKTAIYSIGIGLTALALLVGGIGVMNIMFVTVRERTREIGIRKAVGARRNTILTQFLIEAIVISMIGGVLGIGISIPLSLLIGMVLPASLDAGTVAIAFTICVAIGTIFGLAPAWNAAKMPPIEALRYE